ncbi:MAG TPA: PAS domain-containing protein [Vicinamibacterales bacterium]|jgi:PAS domain S-box-containing protein|nr:PAS domain-containing protein [Vicinamibacterales bacterium]
MSELVGVFPPSLDRDPLRRALDCLEEGFQIIGYDWHYLYLNPAAARHSRRPALELIGHSIFEEYPGIDQTPLFRRLRRSMEERVPQVFENEFTFPDGTKRWFELRVQPAPEGICVYSTDIDQRKRRQLATSRNDRAPVVVRLWRSLVGHEQTRSSDR